MSGCRFCDTEPGRCGKKHGGECGCECHGQNFFRAEVRRCEDVLNHAGLTAWDSTDEGIEQLVRERDELNSALLKLEKQLAEVNSFRRDSEGKITKQHTLLLDTCPRCEISVPGIMMPFGVWALKCTRCGTIVTVNPEGFDPKAAK